MDEMLILSDGTEIENAYAARDRFGEQLWVYITGIADDDPMLDEYWLMFRNADKISKITYKRNDEIVEIFTGYNKMTNFDHDWRGTIHIGLRKVW